jgi:tetratricopeptide (TPR) repeat protein
MMIEQHYDDETLVVFLQDEPAARRDAHLSDCSTCRDTLQTLRHLAGALASDAVWETREFEETPRQSTIDFLRAKQAELGRVDAEAAPRLKQLVSQPRETWAGTLDEHQEWRTAGMVRALVAEAERSVGVMPPDAVELARVAVSLAHELHSSHELVAALREYAFTLYFTGQYPLALRTAEAAGAAILNGDVAEIEAARVRLLRGLILADLGRDDEALALARDAAQVFASANDKARYAAAVRTQGISLYHLRRHREAIAVFESVSAVCASLDQGSFAGLMQNMALCYREIGDFANATRFFLIALDTFQRLNVPVGIAKTRWHLGRTFLAQGKTAEALALLSDVRREFEELTMVQDVALVTIDIAQALMVLGKHDEVPALCRRASDYFASAELTRTEGALTAMALIREAAVSGLLSGAIILRARSRVEASPEQLLTSSPG